MSHPSSELLPHDGSVSATGQEPTAAFGLTGGRAAAEATPDRSQAARVEKSCPALTSQLNEAVVSLRGAVQSGGGMRSSRELLSKALFRKALLHAREEDWGEAAASLREAFSYGEVAEQPARTGLGVATAVAVVYQLGGLRKEAASLWEQVRRADPTDVVAAHSLFISSLVRALHGGASESDGGDLRHWREAAVSALLLMHEESFADELRRRSERRYGQNVGMEQIEQMWRRFEHLLKKRLPLPATLGLIFDVERASAAALAKLGGLPLPGRQGDRRVVGSLRLRSLGYSKEFGAFISGLLRGRGQSGQTIRIVKTAVGGAAHQVMPSAQEILRLLRYFSCYSSSQVLLDQGFPHLALKSLEYPCQEECATGP